VLLRSTGALDDRHTRLARVLIVRHRARCLRAQLLSHSEPEGYEDDENDQNDENEENEREEEEERHTTLSEFLEQDLDCRQGLDERACASYLARIARALEDLSLDVRAIREEQCKRRESIDAHRCGDGVVFVASATTHKYRDLIVASEGKWRLTRTKAAGQTLGYLFTPEAADACAAQLARAGISVAWQ
jgi:hypothetical protein